MVLFAFSAAVAADVRRFDFGTEGSKTPAGWVKVSQRTTYDPAKGYGWETALRAVDVTSWWNPQFSDAGVIGALRNDLADPMGADIVFGYRFFGWKFDKELDKQGVDRLKTVPNDPIPATFIVDLPDGEYTCFLGLGDAKLNSYQYAPFKVSFNGEARIAKVAPGAVAERRVEGVKVAGGKLRITFEALPEDSNHHPYPWNKFCAWEANFLIVAPAAEKAALDAELARLKTARENSYWEGFAQGTPSTCRIVDGYIVKDGKPFLRLLWHGWGWNNLVTTYRFYALTNTINTNTTRPFLSFDGWPDPNWAKLALDKVRLPQFVEEANAAYASGYLVNPYGEWTKVMPGVYRDRTKYSGDDLNADGRTTQWEPSVWAPEALEWAHKVFEAEAAHTGRHPGVASIEIIEEYWLVPGGYSEPSKKRYREWLAKRYGNDVAKLNAEWNTTYPSFDVIDPPKKPNTYTDLTPNHACLHEWQRQHNIAMVEAAYAGVKKGDPDLLVAGGKGEMGTACYDYARGVDVLHWYSSWNAAAARAGCEKWGRAYAPVYVNPCGLHKVRGGNPVGTDPWGERYRLAPYPEMLSKCFEGARAIFNEDYVNSPDFHYYHFTKQWKGQKHEGTLGGALEFITEDLPDVFVEEKTLQLARFNQMGYRLAPVLLPAKVPRAAIALVHTPESFFTFDDAQVYTGVMAGFERLCQSLHLRHDVVHGDALATELPKYKVAVLTMAAQALKPDQVETLKKFYAAGGTIVFADGGAGMDGRTLQWAPFLGEFRKTLGIASAPLSARGDIQSVKNKFTPNVPEGAVFRTMLETGEPQASAAYDTSAGQTALAKVGGQAVMIANADGRCFVLTTGQLRKTYRPRAGWDASYLALFRDVFAAAGAKADITVEGTGKPERVFAGWLAGPGYWLVGLANFTREAQPLTVKLDFLPAGNYDVVDLTGERAIVAKDAQGQNHLKPDIEMRGAKALAANASAASLKTAGLPASVEPVAGRVWMVRPAGQGVLVDAPEYAFWSVARKGVTIVPGDALGAAGKAQAEAVRATLAALGVKATVAAEKDIATRPSHNEVKADGVLLETFDAEPLVTATDLILLGSEATNGLVRRLHAPATFTYDKVLEKVTPAYPGPGRGVLALVDSVNNEAFDATDRSRDAILVGGSDPAGQAAAVNALVNILRKRPEPR